MESKIFKILLVVIILFLPSSAARADERNNVVLVQTDDQSLHLLEARFLDASGKRRPAMPALGNILRQRGVSFTNHFAASPVCAPNRTALLSGRYPHNTNVVSNGGIYGGWAGWRGSDAFDNTFVQRLDQSGYHTAHFGKWTNFYGEDEAPIVPPGWDSWMTDTGDESTRMAYGYRQFVHMPRKGIFETTTKPLGRKNYSYRKGLDPKGCRPVMSMIDRCYYHTDRMTAFAADEIRFAAKEDQPFYIQVDYHSPHADRVSPPGPQPATRHLLRAERTPLPTRRNNPNYNERTDRDKSKPFLIRKNNGPITRKAQSQPLSTWRRGLEAMMSVDDGIRELVRTLKNSGEWENTYFLFTTDNGYFYGDHRFLASKFLAYQESARLPLLVAGPGLAGDKRTNIPSSTVDIAPTVLELTGSLWDGYPTDGRSLVPEILEPGKHSTFSWQYNSRVQLIEMINAREIDGYLDTTLVPETFLNPRRKARKAPSLHYRAIKVGRYKYVDYNKTTDELYDLLLDPEEMKNLISSTRHQEILASMQQNLAAYKACRGQGCLLPPSSAEEGP